jgi:DDE superfamily endonuclease
MHDQTAARTEGIGEQLRLYPSVQVLVDAGYRGLAKEYPDQVTCPPKRPGGTASSENIAEFDKARKAQSSARISVEHGLAELKAWRPLQRWIGKREYLPETALAIASLASDRVRTA